MIQIELIDIFLAIGLAQGLLLSLVLSTSKKNIQANRVLAFLMMLWALIPFEIFMVRSESYYLLPWLIGVFWPISVALLPTLWLYVNWLLGTPNKNLFWHYLPVPFYYALLQPFFLQTPDLKLAQLFQSDIPGSGIWQLQWMSFVVLAQNLIYLPLALHKTMTYQRNLENVSSNPEKHNVHWLFFVILTSMAAFLVSMIGAFYPVWMLETQSLMAGLISASLFYASFHSMTQAQVPEEQRVETSTVRQKPKQRDANFDAIAESVANRLRDVMENQQPYLDYDISLAQLAEQVGVDRHLLSEVLNQHLNTKFYDFINQYRIEAAISLMTTDKPGNSFTQIASETGFKSRTTFYNAFKKQTGQSPSDWMKSNFN